jgi:hypothetical protein
MTCTMYLQTVRDSNNLIRFNTCRTIYLNQNFFQKRDPTVVAQLKGLIRQSVSCEERYQEFQRLLKGREDILFYLQKFAQPEK